MTFILFSHLNFCEGVLDVINFKTLRKFNVKCRNHLIFENCICAHKNVFKLLVVEGV